MKVTRLAARPDEERSPGDFALDVLLGLSEKPKRIPSKYLYDDEGTRLFQKISRLPEYDIAHGENQLLRAIASAFPGIIPDKELDIIELGPGDGSKSELLLSGLKEADVSFEYFPVDISSEAMRLLEGNLETYPVHGIVSDYVEGLRYLRAQSGRRQLVLFLGSNIGNFKPDQARNFLRMVWNSLRMDDYLMVGFDLKKDIPRLNKAYNDSEGFTRDFNMNILHRMNRELGGNFNTRFFRHYGFYNPVLGAMESFLISLQDHEVYIRELKETFHFAALEPIHLEYSYKFSARDIEDLAEETGYVILHNFKDSDRQFMESLWQVKKRGPRLIQ